MFIKYQNERLKVTSITEYTDGGRTNEGKYMVSIKFGTKSRLLFSETKKDHDDLLESLDFALEVEKKFIRINTIRVKGTSVTKFVVIENPTTNTFRIDITTNSKTYSHVVSNKSDLDKVVEYMDKFFGVVNI